MTQGPGAGASGEVTEQARGARYAGAFRRAPACSAAAASTS